MNTRKRQRETKKITLNTGKRETDMRKIKKIKDEDSSLYLDDMIMEILKRLNPKTLVRFRSVSKLWNYMIRHPYFVDLHRKFSSSPMILCSFFYKPNYYDPRTIPDLYIYTISDRGGVSHYWTIKASDIGFKEIKNVSQVVNGLVCVNDFNRVAVCNISTREVIHLPKTRNKSISIDHRNKYQEVTEKTWFIIPFYSLGFDPFTKEYKVIRFWVNSVTYFIRCELFTLGRSKYWRTIDDVPTDPETVEVMMAKSIYIRGSLYWFGEQLVIFNFRNEKFTTIEMESNPNLKWGFPIQVEGCFAVRGLDCIYMLDDEKQVWGRKDFDIGKTRPVGSSETNLFFLEEQDDQKDVQTRHFPSSLNLIRFDQKGQKTILAKITDGSSFPFSLTLLTGVRCIANITDHVENIHPLIEA